MGLSKKEAKDLAKRCGYDSSIQSVTTITSLWGGMGHVYRIRLADTTTTSLIVKLVDARRANPNDIGDKRKLDSYAVEVNFYRYYSPELKEKGVRIPTFLYEDHDDSTHRTMLCLSELFNAPTDNFHHNVLDWLARFHAATWQKEAGSNGEQVQTCGTYWHLDTRPSEWRRMSDRGWEGRLKRAARPIDEFLKESTQIKSWVHGDAKDANVMWDGTAVAMCDFQYVGVGCPLKDLSYFLCSSVLLDDESLVDYYYNRLNCLLGDDHENVGRKEFDFVLRLCYCDYMRFMCGWGQWGSDLTDTVKETLDLIDGGRLLESESAYKEAIQTAFEGATS